jgi:2-polyprenyl-3-methyl-5-hydroxy-6-metoxy-1,4-benzoquinol methylase
MDSWSEIATRYAEVSGDTRRQFLHPALVDMAQHLPLRNSCLDWGCGPGELTGSLAELFNKVVAVDNSHEMVRQAGFRLGSQVTVRHTSDISDCRDQFEAIVLSLVVTTIGSDEELFKLLTDLCGRLAPKGRLLLGTTHPCFTFRALAQVSYAATCAPYSVPIGTEIEVTEFHRPLERLVNLLSNSGLSILQMREVYDSCEFYEAQGETPHRFAGLLPMFMICECGRACDGGPASR